MLGGEQGGEATDKMIWTPGAENMQKHVEHGLRLPPNWTGLGMENGRGKGGITPIKPQNSY